MIRTYSGTTKSWILNLRSLSLLNSAKQLTQDNMDKYALNLNIIQNLASAIEGTTRSLLINHIENSKLSKEANKKVDLELKAILNISLNTLYNASWRDINSMAFKLINFKLNEVFSEDFGCINSLFHFRNITAHGGTLVHKIDLIPKQPELGFDSEEEMVEYNNKRELTKYLVEAGLLDSHVSKQAGTWEYFNDNIVDHFYQNANKFMLELYKKYQEKFDACNSIKVDGEIVNKYCNR
jgi:hypothetical protein